MECYHNVQKVRVARRRNAELNRQIFEERKNPHAWTILLVGPEQSGKSTFIKQMREIHGSGFSEEDKRRYTQVVFQNIFTSVQTLIRAMETLHILYTYEYNKDKALLVNKVDVGKVATFANPYVDAIKSLWNDPGTQECYNRRWEYQLSDSTKYFLDALDRISDSSYLPTPQDILRVSHTGTVGCTEHSFIVHETTYRFIDIGKQHSQLRKWIPCFEESFMVIFFVSLSEYDNKNKMEETMALFRLIIGSPWLKDSKIVLSLNKKDLLQEKIMTSDLADYYPNYEGPREDAMEAQDFICKIFEELRTNPTGSQHELIYPVYMNATDTENMRFVLSTIFDLRFSHRTCNCSLFW